MKYLKTVTYSLLLLFVILMSLLAFLLTTTPGIYTVIKITGLFLPGDISIQKPKGQLLDEFSIAKLTYTDATLSIEADDIHINWKLLPLLQKQLKIKHFIIDNLNIHIKDTKEAIEETRDMDFGFPALPIAPNVGEILINDLKIKQLGVTRHIKKVHIHDAVLNNQQWLVKELGADYQGYQYHLVAKIKPNMPYEASASLEFSPLKKEAGLHGKMSLSGDWQLYHWQGQFKGAARGSLYGTLKTGREVFLKASWNRVNWPLNGDVLSGKKGEFVVSGTLPDLEIKTLMSLDKPVAAHLEAHATVIQQKIEAQSLIETEQGNIQGRFYYDGAAKPAFKGELKSKSLNLTEFGIPIKQLEFNTVFSGSSPATLAVKTSLTAEYLEHLLRADIRYDQQTIESAFFLGANHIRIRGTVPYGWKLSATLPEPELLHPNLQGLQTALKIEGNVDSANQGKMHLTLRPGVYHTPDNDALPPIPFSGGRMIINLTPDGLTAQGSLAIDGQKRLGLDLTLPKFHLGKASYQNQPLTGELNAQIDSLAFLSNLSEAIQKTRGSLNLTLKIQGTVKKPDLRGQIKLRNGSVFLPHSDLTLSPITATIETQNKQWNAKATIGPKASRLSLKGNGQFTPLLSGELTLTGKQFPISKTAEYTVFVSPLLTLAFDQQHLNIKGSILVPNANLKPISFSNTVDLTSDAVFVSEKKETAPFNVSMDVDIQMGENVALDVRGLKGYLDGQIRLKQLPKGSMQALGELRIRNGVYKAYGQNLVIEEGQLVFGGGSLWNPGIRIRAVRYFKNAAASFASTNELFDFNPSNLQSMNLGNQVTVGIEITGRIDSPEVKLFSIPANLSQADILSMIILGKPASQASQAGGQLLLTAISAMNLDSGTSGLQLLDQLKQTLGFEFDIKTTSQFNQQTREVTDDTALVIGKSLTNRLHLSYNIGLFQEDSNVLTLKYLLNKFLSIQVTASDSGSGIDLIYTRSKG